jgi:uncharacterized protein
VDERIRIAVRVTPRAAANAVSPGSGGGLRVRVTAPPSDGAANDAVVALVAKALDVRPTTVRIERGQRSRQKILSVPAGARPALARLLK